MAVTSAESPASALVRASSMTLGLAYEHQLADPATDHEQPDDEVLGLRAWGTSLFLPLRSLSDSRVIATNATAQPDADAVSTTALQRAQNALATVSHGLEVVRDGPWWRIRDRVGNAQLKQDGRPTREASLLLAGTEIKLAGQTLIAESARSLALRNFCGRLLGWCDDRAESVDQALRAIRLADAGRSALVLRGRGDLVLVAHTLHRRALGDGAAFVVSDPRRRNTPATVRSPANVALGVEAFRKASYGTLCVRASRVPPDFDDVLRLFREPHSTVRLTVCAGASVAGRDAFALTPARIEIPSLETRRAELYRIAREYLEDAVVALRAPAACFDGVDSSIIRWILDRSAISGDITIPDIEKAAVRCVALRISDGDLTKAATLLGMARVSLQRWLTRRQ